MQRNINNPLIKPSDVKPSHPEFKVECSFNAGVIEYKDEVLLLVRVAESVKNDDKTKILVPVLDESNDYKSMTIKEFDLSDDRYDFSDSREIKLKSDPSVVFLTSISHLRIARSKDGVKFDIDEKPFIFPDNQYEIFGCEDPRITKIEDKFYINYSAVSPLGITTALAVTQDFKSYEKKGIIFSPDNRDVCFFPEKINGKYVTLHRPAPKHFGKPEIWLAESDDLMHWGNHSHLLGSKNDEWDALKIGGGAPVLKTDKGWLQIYHGVDLDQRYCLGALLLDFNDPRKVLAKSETALLEPTAPYEETGFFGNVVFTCGALIKENTLHVYYGAADEVMALATISIEDLWKHLNLK